jgi:quinoprotein glucose dehydrogenase
VISRRSLLLTSAAAFAIPPIAAWAQTPPDTEWRHYANDLANTRYAPLDQINAGNFSKLEVAWRFKTDNLGPRPEYQYEVTPLMVGGWIYATAGSRRAVVCLNAATGELKWVYSLDEGPRGQNAPRQLSGRGCSYWSDGKGEERILYVTPGYQLIALDAHTGQPIKNFGENGIVDLKRNDDQVMDPITADIGLHATPLVAGNTVVVGAAHLAGNVPRHRSNVKGYVRGFDVRTGRRKWIFHTIPRKDEFGYDTWTHAGDAEQAGNTGVWSEMSADLELGLVYLPVELPTGDFVGIYRQGPALFGESLVAVEISTGKRRWHYQTAHHGLWDRDLPCAPILCDIPHDGKIVKALAQPSKQGFLYVLNRATGEPIWPIPELPVPAGNVPGEWYSPTQPIPSKPPAYETQNINADTVIDFTPELHAQALELISHYRTGGIYQPPMTGSLDGIFGALFTPASQGGTNWPGGCYDPETHKVFVFSQATVQSDTIVPVTNPAVSEFAYVHGLPGGQIRANGPMGGEGYGPPPTVAPGPSGQARPGVVTVQGLPLLKPPYGRITAIDLSSGDIAWQIAHGETPDAIKNHPALKGLKIPRTGRPGLLGPMVTKTLVVCGEAGFGTTPQGARGAMLRAYDKLTGEEKGAVYMPAPQTGSPMSYMLGGRQYIVVAIGGGSYTAELVAFRLPRA